MAGLGEREFWEYFNRVKPWRPRRYLNARSNKEYILPLVGFLRCKERSCRLAMEWEIGTLEEDEELQENDSSSLSSMQGNFALNCN
ncbi:unnamed protein product [Allacma fusca]|uniref:Uncharacterized protein n=1 Tax=Allacma fusca TaxID=39272 RepID=A0A8J2P3S5_9HEXA|nr:unnamed protein product [Allacma fusca]